jgi:23S rRNA (cytidine1920-2'-O)/16S rRNA (cytidine1409-2'-O)-methyltransferase
MMTRRRRLDADLVRRGLMTSRTEAAAALAAGRVLVNGAPASKPSHQVDPGDAVVLVGEPPRFVSRGGDKLDAALDAFAIDVGGRRALDAGASTGGFTDCLLQRGAAEVIAVDVGHGQLHPRLRAEPRVIVLEHFHVRDLTPDAVGGSVDLAVADLSFISLRAAIEPLLRVCRQGAELVLLVKPQFEAGRAEVSRGRGVITDPEVHRRVRREIDDALRGAGCEVRGWVDSPITGASGNREFLVHAVAAREGCPL